MGVAAASCCCGYRDVLKGWQGVLSAQRQSVPTEQHRVTGGIFQAQGARDVPGVRLTFYGCGLWVVFVQMTYMQGCDL